MMSDSTLVSRHGIKDIEKNRLMLLMITTLATPKTEKKEEKHCNATDHLKALKKTLDNFLLLREKKIFVHIHLKFPQNKIMFDRLIIRL
jgi:hypothetical protein